VACTGERHANSSLVAKSEGKRPLGSRRCRWEGNVDMGLKETGGEGVDWINLAHDRYNRWLL
jgi:hypothetical protein